MQVVVARRDGDADALLIAATRSALLTYDDDDDHRHLYERYAYVIRCTRLTRLD